MSSDFKEITKIKRKVSKEGYIKYLENVIKILLKNQERLYNLIVLTKSKVMGNSI